MKQPRTPGAEPAQAPIPIKAAVPAQQADLPNYLDVDPASITAPVLTRQGWIVPVERRKG